MHETFFKAAAEVATHALCHNAHNGSVIVKDGKIIGRGYNAPPLGDEAQRMCDITLNSTVKPKYDVTCCVHAEWNAIFDALKHHPEELKGATLYFMRIDDDEKWMGAGVPYCTVCSRLALQSGIETFALWNGEPVLFDTKTYNQKSYNYYR
jgi:deoxycytidylate deaminase